jgi:MFS family permease
LFQLSAQSCRGNPDEQSQTGAVGFALWSVTLLVLALRVSPAEASFLSIWVALIWNPRRVFGSWLSETFGRRYGGILASLLAACVMALAGYLHDAISVFYLMLLFHSYFGNGNFSIVFPYMAELWPGQLRASGFGLVYGMSTSASSSVRPGSH